MLTGIPGIKNDAEHEAKHEAKIPMSDSGRDGNPDEGEDVEDVVPELRPHITWGSGKGEGISTTVSAGANAVSAGDGALVLSHCTVMVVDDNGSQRLMMVRLLRKLGVKALLVASNGREALDQLVGRGRPVDIILSDLCMPEMDGVEFLGHVAEGQWAQAVVVVSGLETSILNTVETMAKASGLQVLGTIEKPLGQQELTECVARFRPREAFPSRPR